MGLATHLLQQPCRVPLRRIVGAEQGTVLEHITVHIVKNGISVIRGQAFIRVVRERGIVWIVRKVARRVIGERFGGNDGIIGHILNSSLGYSTELIISITKFGILVKVFSERLKTATPEGVAEKLMNNNYLLFNSWCNCLSQLCISAIFS